MFDTGHIPKTDLVVRQKEKRVHSWDDTTLDLSALWESFRDMELDSSGVEKLKKLGVVQHPRVILLALILDTSLEKSGVEDDSDPKLYASSDRELFDDITDSLAVLCHRLVTKEDLRYFLDPTIHTYKNIFEKFIPRSDTSALYEQAIREVMAAKDLTVKILTRLLSNGSILIRTEEVDRAVELLANIYEKEERP